MNHKKIYDRLIEKRRKERAVDCLIRHHIVPRCMGGTNRSDNVVMLTVREARIATWLLSRQFPQNKKLMIMLLTTYESSSNEHRSNTVWLSMINRMKHTKVAPKRRRVDEDHEPKQFENLGARSRKEMLNLFFGDDAESWGY